MSIQESFDFDNTGESLVRRLFLTLVIILVAVLSFGVGRLTGSHAREPIRIEYDPNLAAPAVSQASSPVSSPAPSSGGVIASKSGSKYHYPSCPGAKQIKEANKISFPSAQAAEAAGYTLASNCKGP